MRSSQPSQARAARFMAAVTVLSLSGSPAHAASFELLIAPTAEASNDFFGFSAKSAGDLNADGFDDLVVGAPNNGAGGTIAGRAYVYFGGPGADATADLVLTGSAFDMFGVSVARAGDVNGDGFDDLIVGASGGLTGRAYVFHGGPAVDATADLTLTCETPLDLFGTAVAGAGDVNGDGFDDVIVGAPYNDSGGIHAGRAYVFHGGPGADPIADLVFTGATDDERLGSSVAAAGDVDGDGFDDLIVGAYVTYFSDAGSDAYVYLGGPGADATPDLVLAGEAGGDEFGVALGAGDINGDGFADVIVGASSNDAGGNNAGRAYLYYGGPGVDATPDLVLTGDRAFGQLGRSVAGAGDVNGDGVDDVVVGAPSGDERASSPGRAYVYYGGSGGDAVADVVIVNETDDLLFGISVAGAGDFDGDGLADVFVGAPHSLLSGSGTGRAYAYGLEIAVASLDIRPGACPNALNDRSQGVLPVALLSRAALDVNDIDVTSLRLEGVAPLRWDHEDVSAPLDGEPCGCGGAAPDGLTDLTLKFRTQDILAAMGSPLRHLRRVLTLTGTTFDGTPLIGHDCVVGVGRAEPEAVASDLQLIVSSGAREATQQIRFTMPAAAEVTLAVHDVTGRAVRQLLQSWREAGPNALTWNASGLSSGVYFYRLKAGSAQTAARFILIR